jgi:hypothetical protein
VGRILAQSDQYDLKIGHRFRDFCANSFAPLQEVLLPLQPGRPPCVSRAFCRCIGDESEYSLRHSLKGLCKFRDLRK